MNGTPLSIDGGAAASSGFNMSIGASTVLGFSFTGTTISSGYGVLAILMGENITTISNIVISDSEGNEINFCLLPNCE